ncbi:unannotated protein [freshwater metagenome]|uniref:Unannotated protein n=1 Tax=freshwater metagenome TaxID=449393 RepID=A0A6J7IJC2_9ZZZZ
MVDARDDPGHAVLGLCEEGHDEVDLVVACRRDHDLALGEPGLLEGGDLACIGKEHVGTLDDARAR